MIACASLTSESLRLFMKVNRLSHRINALLMPASAALSVVAGEDSSGQQPQPFAISARDSSHKHTCNIRCKALSFATVTTETLKAAEAGRAQASWIWRSLCAAVVVRARPGPVHVPVVRPGPTAGGQRDSDSDSRARP